MTQIIEMVRIQLECKSECLDIVDWLYKLLERRSVLSKLLLRRGTIQLCSSLYNPVEIGSCC